MGGAAGVGFLYVARKHLEKTPSRAGYIAAGGFNAHEFSLVPSAERPELGMPNLKERGLNIITPEAPEHRLGVIAAWLKEAIDLNRFLLDRGVDTCTLPIRTTIPYPGSVFRVDPHIYNNHQDIDRLLEGVDTFYAKD